MKKKNKQTGTKKKSKLTKWIIALAILTLIAVAVVCIIVFIPKNVDDVKRETKAQAETCFLKDDEEASRFSDFEAKVTLYASKYISEFQSAKYIAESLNDVIDFYANEVVFIENNGTFQANYYTILDNFKVAKEHQSQLDGILKEVDEKVNASSSFTEGAWEDFRAEFSGYVKSYTGAFKGLSQVYRDCAADGLIHNSLTYLVLDSVNDYLEVINETSFGKISFLVYRLNKFVTQYIAADTTPIKSFKFSESLENEVKTINKFSEIYSGQTLKDVIKTCNAGQFSYPASDKDTTGVLTQVKSFLNGGLGA